MGAGRGHRSRDSQFSMSITSRVSGLHCPSPTTHGYVFEAVESVAVANADVESVAVAVAESVAVDEDAELVEASAAMKRENTAPLEPLTPPDTLATEMREAASAAVSQVTEVPALLTRGRAKH